MVFHSAGWLYFGLNALVAIVGYQAVIDLGVDFGLSGKPEWWRALASASVAMAVLRSSFATVKVGSGEVGIGFITFLDVFKRHAERKLDQGLTEKRWHDVGNLVGGMNYRAAREYLMGAAVIALPSLSQGEREDLIAQDTKISSIEGDDGLKLQLLALLLESYMGLPLLKMVITDGKSEIDKKAIREEESLEALSRQLAGLKGRLQS